MRLIDADALIERNKALVDCEFIHAKYQATLREVVDDEPTVDAVEVVRCKDCKWCRLYQLFGTDNYQCERSALSAYFWVEPTDYCSYGERREVQRNFNASNVLDALETEVTE